MKQAQARAKVNSRKSPTEAQSTPPDAGRRSPSPTIVSVFGIDSIYGNIIIRSTIESKADLLLHPIRLRIVGAFASAAGSRRLTVQELAQILDDVPQTTLYRHVQKLFRGGILAIAASRQVRGTVERTYVLTAGGARLSPADLAAASREDHLRYFNAFVAGLLARYARYLQRPEVDLVADGVGYRMMLFDLDDEEFAELTQAMNRALAPFFHRGRREGRTKRLLATVLMPVDGEPED